MENLFMIISIIIIILSNHMYCYIAKLLSIRNTYACVFLVFTLK